MDEFPSRFHLATIRAPLFGIASEQIGFHNGALLKQVLAFTGRTKWNSVLASGPRAISNQSKRSRAMNETSDPTNPIEESAGNIKPESAVSELSDSALEGVVGGDNVVKPQPSVKHSEFTVTKFVDIASPKLYE
jgi:hypothetical protein